MRPLPDDALWSRLSALFDTGSALPTDLRRSWLEGLREDESPQLVGWLVDMLAGAEVPNGDEVERGPQLPAAVAMGAATAEARAPGAGSDPSPSRDLVPAPDEPPPPVSAPSPEGASVASGTGGSSETSDPAVPGSTSEEVAEQSLPAEALIEPAQDPAHDLVSDLASDLASDPAPDPAPEPVPDPSPELEPVPRLAAPTLATGMHLGPWRLLGPMSSSDARVDQWRARRADDEAASEEVALLVPRQWRPRPELAAWLQRGAARAVGLVHPHIARLIAVGVTDEGTPWLAAQLAEGQPIDRWCRDHPLGLAERRQLLEQALEAVTFAHGRLVLHGRIHPSQIVLTPDKRLRVLNLGLSDLLDMLESPAADPVAGPAGPPASAYMAAEAPPEAGVAGPRGLSTVAADIYALGLVAFEVLSGASPWQPRAPGTPAVAAPGSRWPRPSESAGAQRLRRALRGSYDAIVVKATQTDPALRYASAAGLLDDIRRAGQHRSVAAVDGGFIYQVGCLVRRRRLLSGIVAATAAAFFVAIGILSWKAWVWTNERDQAEASRRSGEAVSRLTQELLRESVSPGMERDWPGLLARAESVARSSLKDHPGGLAAALAMIGRHQAERGAFAEARNLLAEAIPQLADATTAREAGCDEAWAQARQGDKPDEAELRLRRVTEDTGVRPATRVLCLARLADLERRSGRPRDAYQTSFTAWRLWDESGDKVPQLAVMFAHPMGRQSASLGRFHESQLWLEWTLKQLQLLQQDTGSLGAEMREQWTEVSLAAGDAERATKLADENLAAVAGEAFPADAQPATAAPASLFLAAAEPRLDLHRLTEANARIERAIALADAREDPPMRQRARCAMAVLALRERDPAAAEKWLKAAGPEAPAGGTRRVFGGGAEAPATGAAATSSATAVTSAQAAAGVLGMAPASAAEDARNAARVALREADHACRAAAIELALVQGRHAEAQREAEKLLGAGDELSPRLRAVVNLLRAEASLAARQYERAVSAGLQALQQARALHQSDIEDQKARPSFRSGQAALVLAEAHRASGDIEEAKKTLDYAMQQLSATLPATHPWRQRAEAVKTALAVHAAKKP